MQTQQMIEQMPSASPAISRRIGRLWHTLSELDERGQDAEPTVQRFWREQGGRSPLLERVAGVDDECVVTFLWRDAVAAEVLLVVGDESAHVDADLDARLMRRIPGTDVWHLSLRMPVDARASYGFVPRSTRRSRPWCDEVGGLTERHLDRVVADPHNPPPESRAAAPQLSLVALDRADLPAPRRAPGHC